VLYKFAHSNYSPVVIFLCIWSFHTIFLCSLFLSYLCVNMLIRWFLGVETIMFLIDDALFPTIGIRAVSRVQFLMDNC